MKKFKYYKFTDPNNGSGVGETVLYLEADNIEEAKEILMLNHNYKHDPHFITGDVMVVDSFKQPEMIPVFFKHPHVHLKFGDYGFNKILIIEIIRNQNKALKTSKIREIFTNLISEHKVTEDEIKTIIINSISSLRIEKKIIGYKTGHKKLKGYYWGLPEWFNNSDLFNNSGLKEVYKP